MQVSLLIVDGITTNRVALKVKLAAAWYDVATAASGAEALALIANTQPSLVLVNDTLPDMRVADLAEALAHNPDQDAPPMIALSKGAPCRSALLSAGIEDILQLPVDDRLLISRIRSVLRAHAAEAEWRLRDGTSRALGFAEPKQQFGTPAPVLLLADKQDTNIELLQALRGEPGLTLSSHGIDEAMRDLPSICTPDVILLPLPPAAPETGLTLLSDLRANPVTRHKAILVVAPKGRADLAAQALDLGADDVAVLPILIPPQVVQERADLASELAVRAQRLHMRHQINQSLRTTIRNGAEAALRDPLTGLYNRRYALPHLERIAEQSEVSSRPFAVMVADLDHFKRINDRYGHAIGDAVLAECARRMQRNMRAVDLVARIGGEEFLIVLPGTGRAAARQAALRLCERISTDGIEVPGVAEPIQVTISIGLSVSNAQPDLFDASLPEPSSDPVQMLERADKALYRAKERGRNRFILERPAA
ncbi:MAG: diguanylate cyclase [Aliishimia sp.]